MNQANKIQLGIRANRSQFSVLVLVNAFVGAMVGMERSILPLIAEQDFGIASRSAILSFLVTFGIVKAVSNLFAGRISDTIGRKKLLVIGWLIGIPVPFMIMFAPSWTWISAANILLGINQGLCWSTTVIMKIDLAGPKRRGFAMGLNEFAGYLAVAIAAYFSASIAGAYGLRPFPFYIGVGSSVAGLVLSFFFIKETRGHTVLESSFSDQKNVSSTYSFKEIFFLTSWKDKNLFSCSQAGLVNNLNDGVAWGLFPLLFLSAGFSIQKIGFLTALYPAVWGMTQLVTGVISDRAGRKWMIASGMWLQSAALVCVAVPMHLEVVAMLLLGLGTAMVYPLLLAGVGDSSAPEWRASAIGVYRLWRDLGYALGAVVSGILADTAGIENAIIVTGVLTFCSGIVFAFWFQESQ